MHCHADAFLCPKSFLLVIKTNKLNYSLATVTKLLLKGSCGNSMLQVFPNPADNQLIINLDNQQSLKSTASTESKRVTLFNKNGVILRSVTTTENQVIFDVSKIAKGTYYLRVVKNNGLETKLVVIQH